jgi:soluble P-type ATPase
LILAAPVAVVGGMSRAARRGIIVKNGVALETLGRADVVLFDKTGTLTEGRARLARIETHAGVDPDEVLRLAASVDQASTHALARALVGAAHERGLTLALADSVIEDPGRGVQGTTQGHRVAVGRAAYVSDSANVPEWAQRVRKASASEGLTNVFVAVDGRLSGVLVLEDAVRVDAARAVQRLRGAGVRRVVMVTGDHPIVAQGVVRGVGLDDVYADSTPTQKVDIVETERRRGTVVMAGDGINDAPALAAADVGIAMGARGATASSEAADVVIMVDRIDRVAEGLHIARRTHRIALQSVIAGMTLSFIAMGLAAFGLLVPVVGAVVQEAIDVAVIINALRTHGLRPAGQPSSVAVSAGQRVLGEHLALRAGTEQLLTVADELGGVPSAKARSDLDSIRRFLREELLPHEQAEERSLYPAVAPYAGGEETVITAQREHAEVARLAETLVAMVEGLAPSGLSDDELTALRRVLYSLYTVVKLHRAGEEERLARVVDEPAGAALAR